MKRLKRVYLNFTHDKEVMFKAMAGESGRGVRIVLDFDTLGKTFKNYIKIDDKIFETEVENITENTFDIVFPTLEEGLYYGEIQIIENDELIKSGIYSIKAKKSFFNNESIKLKEINSDLILNRLSEIEENLNKKIKIYDDALQGKAGLSAYHIWLNEGNTGTEEDFLKSLEGKPSRYVFQLDEDGNLYVDRYE